MKGGGEEEEEEERGAADGDPEVMAGDTGGFRDCRALLTHGQGPAGRPGAGVPVEDPIVSTDEVIFPLTISLDRLPPGTVKAKVVVTVWRRDAEPPPRGEAPGGFLQLLQSAAPSQLFRQQQRGAFKAQVSTLLRVLPPPLLRCRQLAVAGKSLTLLKVQNGCSQEELWLCSVRILPNLNASYLPVLPDGSVLLLDDVCHQSGEVPVGAFSRVVGAGGPWVLRALEEQNFLFQLRAPERPPGDSREGLEVPLVAVVQWSTPKLPCTSSIFTHYRLPSIRLCRPRFLMTASVESPVRALQPFQVTYTLRNDLRDFLAVRLVWTPGSAAGKKEPGGGRGALDAIVCQQPLSNLGYSRKGSALSIRVAFQALRAGLFEMSQHMKLKLQFTASVANAPPAEGRPVSRRSSPSSPAVRDLVERHQSGLGRSQSFSHQQPSRSHLMRSGSALERRAITPPVGSPVGRALPLPQERALLALDKIAKRDCKVLVLGPGQ